MHEACIGDCDWASRIFHWVTSEFSRVAQVSQPAVSRFPISSAFQSRWASSDAGLEIRDTVDWEVGATRKLIGCAVRRAPSPQFWQETGFFFLRRTDLNGEAFRLKRLWLIGLLGGFGVAIASPPPGYYDSAQGKAGQELRDALHAIIRNHQVIPYSSGSRQDTSDALKVLDRDAANFDNVINIYSGSSATAASFGLTTGWNREHLWCNSYGLDDVEPSYSDLHNLRACDANVNSSRGNKFYDTTATNSTGYAFPAHSEAPLCSTDSDSWEPPVVDRGNIARSLFYMATRYTGDAANEPALTLTDNSAQINSVYTAMGKLSTLLAWHNADPVDAAEQLRNDLVYSLYQTNRNPFVDHPEWVNLTFAPAHTNSPKLSIIATPPGFTLSWIATNQCTQLEFSTNLPFAWQDTPATPILTNNQFIVSWTNSIAGVFFRLRAW
jgi:endonuclease I